jgi:hypothetical protein
MIADIYLLQKFARRDMDGNIISWEGEVAPEPADPSARYEGAY